MNSTVREIVSGSDTAVVIGTTEDLHHFIAARQEDPIELVVAEAESFPDFDFDPAEMVSILLREFASPPRYILAVRTPGAASPRSQSAFSAEIFELCDARTVVLVEDAVSHKRGRVSDKKDGTTASANGIVQVRQWAEIGRYVQELLDGGAIRQFSPIHSEAVALVSAMYGGSATQKALGKRHRAVLVGLANHDSAVLPEKLGYASKTVSNAYGEIAKALSKVGQPKPQVYCCELIEQYRGWLQSFGRRNRGSI
jgi:hypothetical protein